MFCEPWLELTHVFADINDVDGVIEGKLPYMSETMKGSGINIPFKYYQLADKGQPCICTSPTRFALRLTVEDL